MGQRSLAEKYREGIIEVLADHGISGYRFESCRKHMRCYFMIPNKGERFVVFPKTPGDAKGALNCKQDVRRELRRQGVQPI